MARRQSQLTLFQCVESQNSSTKRVKLAQEEGSSSSDGDLSPDDDKDSTELDSDIEGETLHRSLTIPGNQTNNTITLKNPTGPTTVVINRFYQ